MYTAFVAHLVDVGDRSMEAVGTVHHVGTLLKYAVNVNSNRIKLAYSVGGRRTSTAEQEASEPLAPPPPATGGIALLLINTAHNY